ncbi:AI-2E family transporter [Pseudooceanicola nanhaiensis]|jgi:predicted PurR-regulated permease PerM|uniref:AI-2E family transporter n=1 Tax=Pseudooceanicola nanhaiensis TaxID=375761 RepID=A0A917WFI9_9RHOB|nr:AI-2E family transporter [Pseudooceanicola nanhaiensis]GGL98117.1 AI-2E family transporter [Pseudooceanicola nanhaiensis]
MMDATSQQQTSESGNEETTELAERSGLSRVEYLLSGIFILLLFWSISLAEVVIMPIVLGFLIALTLSPVVRSLGRMGVPAPVSAIVLVFAFGLFAGTSVYFLSGPAGDLMDEVPRIRFELREKMDSVKDHIEKVQQASEDMQNFASGGDEGAADGQQRVVVNDDPGILTRALSSLAGLGSSLLIALILSMFLLAAGDMYQRKMVEALPTLTDKKRALRISNDIERQISRYLGAITVINASLGLAVGSVLYLLGMPYAYLWGAAAFLLNYLPYIGALTGVILCAAVSLVTFDTLGDALIPPLAYLGLTTLEGQMLTPMLVGRHLKLNAAVVFIAVVFWAWIWGVAGALMAVPFLVFLKVVCDNVPSLEVFGSFLSGRDDPMAVTGPSEGNG